MSAPYKLSVPAKAAEVNAFLHENRTRFVTELKTVMDMVRSAQASDQRLRSIYKIYSRSEAQAGDELKHPRKVRLKFDAFNRGKKGGTFSLFDTPDIVGFTVVVSYPADITQVCEVFDELIDRRELTQVLPSDPGEHPAIISRHGRVMKSRGYVACHYNVRTRGPTPRPVVEIQIKTVLHDAWGHKTHDLVYKPAGRFDQALLDSFNHLGDMLAQLDIQSDTLRQSLERAFRARSLKRHMVQLESLKEVARPEVLKDAPDGQGGEEIRALGVKLNSAAAADPLAASQWFDEALELINRHPESRSYSCPMICLIAVLSGDSRHEAHAQEALEIWEQDAEEERERLRARSIAALAAFAFGRVSEAIDICEHAVSGYESIDLSSLEDKDREMAVRLASSTYSSLAYYHADMVGSHEGVTRESLRKAQDNIDRCAPLWKEMGLPENGLFGDLTEIEEALSGNHAARIFQTLDSEAFVRIQTATSEIAVREATKRLRWLHEKRPAGMEPLASLLLDFHDFCARRRLSELETEA